jgi:hypothetical protein
MLLANPRIVDANVKMLFLAVDAFSAKENGLSGR